jgi:hypothetical protein
VIGILSISPCEGVRGPGKPAPAVAFFEIQGLLDPAALSEFVGMAVPPAEVTGEPSRSLKRPGAGVVVAAGAPNRPSILVEAIEWSSI